MPEPKRMVLIGAGHAHMLIALRLAPLTRRGVQVTLVDPGNFCYSGLATGVLGGEFAPERNQVDPGPVVERRGGHLVRARALRIRPAERVVELDSGQTLPYDVLSLNVGSRIAADAIAGGGAWGWPVKPVGNLWRLRESLERLLRTGERSARAVVVGGGPTGCEVAACLSELARRAGGRLELHLVTRGERLLARSPERVGRALARALDDRGVRVHCGATVVAIDGAGVVLADGRRLEAPATILATGLQAPPLARESGLPVAADGALRVDAMLRCEAEPRIFGAGDAIDFDGRGLPRQGVYGVRQARVLLANLEATLDGRALRPYRPQRRALSILNLGRGEALAVWGGLFWRGRASWLLKRRLDLAFLHRLH